MQKYPKIYICDTQGLLTRSGEDYTEPFSYLDFTEAEVLKGWPESEVIWHVYADGSKFGLAF